MLFLQVPRLTGCPAGHSQTRWHLTALSCLSSWEAQLPRKAAGRLTATGRWSSSGCSKPASPRTCKKYLRSMLMQFRPTIKVKKQDQTSSLLTYTLVSLRRISSFLPGRVKAPGLCPAIGFLQPGSGRAYRRVSDWGGLSQATLGTFVAVLTYRLKLKLLDQMFCLPTHMLASPRRTFSFSSDVRSNIQPSSDASLPCPRRASASVAVLLAFRLLVCFLQKGCGGHHRNSGSVKRDEPRLSTGAG